MIFNGDPVFTPANPSRRKPLIDPIDKVGGKPIPVVRPNFEPVRKNLQRSADKVKNIIDKERRKTKARNGSGFVGKIQKLFSRR